MENPFNNPNLDTTNNEEVLPEETSPVQEVPVSPLPVPEELADHKMSRRNFITGLTAFTMGVFSPSSKAEEVDASKKVEKQKTPEQEEALLKRIGLERSQIKPEFLKKYFEGAYKAIVIIDTSPEKQSINAYDKEGNVIIKDAEISSGRKGMETPKGSHESGRRELIHVNRDDIDMPYSVAIDEKEGIFMHQGTLTGYPASHGCVRMSKETAKQFYEMAEHNKDLVIVTR